MDYIYQEELGGWEKSGVVEIYTAFSRSSPQTADGKQTKYVQHRLWEERGLVLELVNSGAHIYVCGEGKKMAPAVRETLKRIFMEFSRCSEEKSEHWMHDLETKSCRYVVDVFGYW